MISMKKIYKSLVVLTAALFIQSCFLFAVYGTLRTINDVIRVLNTVNSSMTTIRTVLDEGQNLKRAAEDGRQISYLAERIPGMVKNRFEKAVTDKIDLLSGDLKTTAVALTKHALEENLGEAIKTYNNMNRTYNEFSDLMNDLAQSKNPIPN